MECAAKFLAVVVFWCFLKFAHRRDTEDTECEVFPWLGDGSQVIIPLYRAKVALEANA